MALPVCGLSKATILAATTMKCSKFIKDIVCISRRTRDQDPAWILKFDILLLTFFGELSGAKLSVFPFDFPLQCHVNYEKEDLFLVLKYCSY